MSVNPIRPIDPPGPPAGEAKVCPRCLCCKLAWDLCTECSGVGWYGDSGSGEDDVTGYMCRVCQGQGGRSSCEGSCDRHGRHAEPVKRTASVP